MADDDAVAGQMADLLSLVYDVVSNTSLAQCHALLELLPEPLISDNSSPSERVLRLHKVLDAVVARTVDAFAENPNNMRLHDILAASAAIGLITKPPSSFKGSLADIREQASGSSEYRQALGGLWLLEPVVTAKSFRRIRKDGKSHRDRCLEAFRYALQEFLSDADAVHELAAQIRLMPIGGRLGVTAAAEARKAVLDTSALIPRPDLLESCLRVLNTTGRVCLVGERGTGKSSLAMILAKHISSDEELILLRGNQFMKDVVDALESREIPTRRSDAAVLLRELAQSLEATTTHLLLLDGFDDWNVVGELVSDKTRCRVIVTSNRQPPEAWRRHLVEVLDMTPAEARELALRSTSRLSDEQAGPLVSVLRRRPIAIAQACGYLERTPTTSPDVLQGLLERRMALTLETAAETTERNLKLLHAATLRKLDTTYPAAARLLEFLAFWPVQGLQGRLDDSAGAYEDQGNEKRNDDGYAVAVCYLMLALGLPLDDLEVGLMVYSRSIELLHERYLIKGGYRGAWMHGVTAAVFRSLFEASAQRIEGRIADVYEASTRAWALDLLEDDESARQNYLRFLEVVFPPIHRDLTAALGDIESHNDELVRVLQALFLRESGGVRQKLADVWKQPHEVVDPNDPAWRQHLAPTD